MNPKTIESTFINNKSLPSALVHICDFLETYGYPKSGCFELSSIGMDDLKGWFTRNPQLLTDLMPFGRGACGDVYSLWLTYEKDPSKAPVVIFGSEGELKVLAINAIEFCKLLSLGYSEVGLESHEGLGEDYKETEKFRVFIKNIYKFELPESGIEIIQKANERNPDFGEWVEKHAW